MTHRLNHVLDFASAIGFLAMGLGLAGSMVTIGL